MLYNQNIGYSGLNTARSAVSTYLELLGLPSLGKSPLVCRFMKGVFNTRPSLPRFCNIWNPGVLLEFLTTCEDGSLKMLSQKCACLLTLVSCQRVSTIHGITLPDIHSYDKGITIHISKLQKQSRPSYHPGNLVIEKFGNPALCPVTIVNKYLLTTSDLRGNEQQLFISYQKPNNAVTKDTLSRWITNMLRCAGIDGFGSHSLRSAGTSALYRLGIPIDVIMSQAGWTCHFTFQKHYNLPLLQSVSNQILN